MRKITIDWIEKHVFNAKGYVDGNRVQESWHKKRGTLDMFLELKALKEDNELKTFKEAVYWVAHDLYDKPKCSICKTNSTNFNHQHNYATCCRSTKCKAAVHKQALLKKYGVENYAHTKEFKDTMISKRKDIEYKKKETCLKKYGVDNVMKSQQFKDKLEDSMIEKFGVKTNLLCLSDESIEKREKTFATVEYRQYRSQLQKNFSTEKKEEIINKQQTTLVVNYGSLEAAYNHIKLKSQETCISRYGVSNSQQVPEIHEKTQRNRYKHKEYVMPSGKVVLVQGYEDIALDRIFENNLFVESDVITDKKDVPEIWYKKDKNNNRYYTDIYIPSKNLMIEVKSDYTMNSNLEVNYKKRDACISAGYNFEFWIFDTIKNIYVVD